MPQYSEKPVGEEGVNKECAEIESSEDQKASLGQNRGRNQE